LTQIKRRGDALRRARVDMRQVSGTAAGYAGVVPWRADALLHCRFGVSFASEVVTMHISFPSSAPVFCARDLVMAFPALVDDEPVQCAITAEALEDHFGARSGREEDLVAAFAAHCFEIELAAQRMLNEVGGKSVLLHSGYFRFCT
jgi:hypothetical protein